MKVNVKVVLKINRTYKNKTVPLFIRLIQCSKSKLISTGVAILPEYWDDANQQLTEDCPDRISLQSKIDQKLELLHKQIRTLEVLDVEVTLDALSLSKPVQFNPTLEECFREQMEELKREGRLGSSIRYGATLSSIIKYKKKAKLNDVDLSFIKGFEHFLRERGNSNNTIATHMATLKTIYRKGRSRCRTSHIKTDAFENYKIGSLWSPTHKRAIDKDVVTKLANLALPDANTRYMAFARDIFLFSYYCAGINFKDIALLRYRDIYQGKLHYRRSKTKKIISCILVTPAQEIIRKYAPGYLEAINDDYIFPILDRSIHKTERQIYDRIHKVLQKVNKNLKEISTLLGLKTPLTTYVARHTYATVLKRSGVNIGIISESLGHSELSTTQIYLDSFENSQIEEAMKNLL